MKLRRDPFKRHILGAYKAPKIEAEPVPRCSIHCQHGYRCCSDVHPLICGESAPCEFATCPMCSHL